MRAFLWLLVKRVAHVGLLLMAVGVGVVLNPTVHAWTGLG